MTKYDPFQIDFSELAVEQLRKDVPEDVGLHLLGWIVGPLANDPHSCGTLLLMEQRHLFKGRFGAYVVRYEVDEATRAVKIKTIGRK